MTHATAADSSLFRWLADTRRPADPNPAGPYLVTIRASRRHVFEQKYGHGHDMPASAASYAATPTSAPRWAQQDSHPLFTGLAWVVRQVGRAVVRSTTWVPTQPRGWVSYIGCMSHFRRRRCSAWMNCPARVSLLRPVQGLAFERGALEVPRGPDEEVARHAPPISARCLALPVPGYRDLGDEAALCPRPRSPRRAAPSSGTEPPGPPQSPVVPGWVFAQGSVLDATFCHSYRHSLGRGGRRAGSVSGS
jgi:hypothetical protein